jgi:CheY-like chemotaxis protein
VAASTYAFPGIATAVPPVAAFPPSSRHMSPMRDFVMEIKALVTDSNSKVRKNLTRSLKELGIKSVSEATDGCQAIEMLQKGKYDIVFAEYNTKTAQGDELVTSIRRTDAKTPIVVLAPQSKQMTELKQSYPTASSYLATPFTTEQLKKTVAQCVPSIAG